MKNKTLFIIMFCCFLALSQGCKKDDSQNSPVTIQVNITANQTYQYDLGYFGIEEGVIMVKQGDHFQTSKLERMATENIIYTYISLPGYTGTDQVEVRAGRGSDGASANTKLVDYIFKITISK